MLLLEGLGTWPQEIFKKSTIQPALAIFLALRFCASKSHKLKNWHYNTCLDKTFPSSRNASLKIIQLPLLYSPLNSRSNDLNHQSLQRKLPSSSEFKSSIFTSFLCFSLQLGKMGHYLALIPLTNFHSSYLLTLTLTLTLTNFT